MMTIECRSTYCGCDSGACMQGLVDKRGEPLTPNAVVAAPSPADAPWFKNGGWQLQSDAPFFPHSTRMLQYLYLGDTEESGVCEQHACHVPTDIWAWREKPSRAAAAASLSSEADRKPTNPKDAIGIKKAPLSCVPMNVVAEMGVGMLEGAAKYGRHNYRAVGVRSSVYFDATMRHLIAWWEGEDVDPDSGLSHVTKALVSLAVLRDAQMQGKCTDDRPPRSTPFYADLNKKSATVLDRHIDKMPKHYTIADVVTNQAATL